MAIMLGLLIALFPLYGKALQIISGPKKPRAMRETNATGSPFHLYKSYSLLKENLQ